MKYSTLSLSFLVLCSITTLKAPPKKELIQHQPVNLLPLSFPHEGEPPTVPYSSQEDILRTTLLTGIGAVTTNLLQNQTTIHQNIYSLSEKIEDENRRINELYTTIHSVYASIDDERKRREDGDREDREMCFRNIEQLEKHYTRDIEKLEKNYERMHDEIQLLKEDVERYTGKKFLNLFATIMTLLSDSVCEIEVKKIIYNTLFWNKEQVSNRMLSYLFIITTLLPLVTHSKLQTCYLYKWIVMYTLFALPFWMPLKILTQLNVLNRVFWAGFEGFDSTLSRMSSYDYIRFCNDHTKFIARSMLALFVITLLVYCKKHRSTLKKSRFIQRISHLFDKFFHPRDILLQELHKDTITTFDNYAEDNDEEPFYEYEVS